MPVCASSPAQRVGPLAQLPTVLAEHAVTLDEILDGLPVAAQDLRPELFLPIRVISAIMDRVAAHEGLSKIGLLLAKAQNYAVLGPVGQLMASCETLGSALGTYVALQMTNSTAAAAYLHPVGDDYALGFGIYAPGGGFIFNGGHFIQPDIPPMRLVRAYRLVNKLAAQYGTLQ